MLPYVKRGGRYALANDHYDNDLLEAMHRAMIEACAELGISTDRKIRQLGGIAVLAVGRRDAQRLKSVCPVSRFPFELGIT